MSLTPSVSVRDFRDYYWTKLELQTFCRDHGLSPGGGKREIADRIATFLENGSRLRPSNPRRGPGSAEAKAFNQLQCDAFRLDMPVPEGFRCTQELRAFMERAVSPQFRFTVSLQRFMRDRPGITLAQVAAQFHQEQAARRSGQLKTEIAPQFEFNQFTRDYYADPRNANKSRADCLAAWKRTRDARGDNRYRSPDE